MLECLFQGELFPFETVFSGVIFILLDLYAFVPRKLHHDDVISSW